MSASVFSPAALERPLPRRRPRVASAEISTKSLYLAVFLGGILSGAVHGVISAGLTGAMAKTAPVSLQYAPTPGGSSVGYGICDKRRCSSPEQRAERRDPEPPPVKAPQILEAALVPKLGGKEQDKRKLPELQAYEQKEIVKDGVNLERDNKPPEEQLKKRFRARKAKFDKRNKSVRDLLDHRDDDPRKRVRSVEDIVGVSDGEVGGEGTIRRPGNLYVKRVRRVLERDFLVPTHLGADTLATLQVRIKVQRMGPDGAILAYRIIKRSGSRAFDDAVLRLLLQYIPEEKGKKRLPVPDPDVLRYINLKGMKIDLLGERLK